MSKRDAAPTLGWVVVSHVNKWLAIIFLIVLFVIASGVYVVYQQLEADCSDTFIRDVQVGSYQLHYEVSSECPSDAG